MDPATTGTSPHSRKFTTSPANNSNTNNVTTGVVGSGTSSRLSVASGDWGNNSTTNNGQSSVQPSLVLPSALSPAQYLSRLTDASQMDLQSALDQMKTLLLTPSQTHKVYKMAYYRKQTKNHWARDDPAFVALQMLFLSLTSLAYSVAFRPPHGILSCALRLTLLNILLHYLLSGVVVATLTRWLANTHLQTMHASSTHVRQSVEWLYAFDIHANAFWTFFVLIYGVQFFFLPIVLGKGLASMMVANTLWAVAGGWYFYVLHMGFRALPFLSNTEVFLFPIAGILFIYILNYVAYPFGFGWNLSRIVAHIYFNT